MPKTHKRDTTTQGAIGELKTIMKVIKEGWVIYQPLIDVDGCDMIAERDGVLRKLQVKFHTTMGNSETSIIVYLNDKKVNADFIAIPIERPELGISEVVFVPYEGQQTLSIAFNKAKNGQKKGRRWYKDFLELY
tara:strand:+ start:2368 stop:2769 length:402 start_codon:yes stop_codon:yes gene_type:complete